MITKDVLHSRTKVFRRVSSSSPLVDHRLDHGQRQCFAASLPLTPGNLVSGSWMSW